MTKKFEDILQEKVSRFSVPFREKDFQEFQSIQKRKRRKKKIRYASIFSAVLLIVFSALYYFRNYSNQGYVQRKETPGSIIKRTETPKKTEIQSPPAKEETAKVESKQYSSPKKETKKADQPSDKNLYSLKEEKQNSNVPGPMKQKIKPSSLSDSTLEKNDLLLQVIPSKWMACVGEKIRIDLKTNLKNALPVIKIGNTEIKGNEGIFIPDSSGYYSIHVDFHAENQIIYSYDSPNKIIIKENPSIQISYVDSSYSLSHPYIWFYTTAKGISCHWEINQKEFSGCFIKYPVTQSGYIDVSLSATNQYGCKSEEHKQIYLDPEIKLLAPNAFSPNGDGLNDVFIPEALLEYPYPFHFRIISPSGTVVYETNEPKAWNGRLQNTGESLPENTYVWEVILYDQYEKPHRYIGKVKIVN
jgi:hypothetical protein